MQLHSLAQQWEQRCNLLRFPHTEGLHFVLPVLRGFEPKANLLILLKVADNKREMQGQFVV